VAPLNLQGPLLVAVVPVLWKLPVAGEALVPLKLPVAAGEH